MFHQLAARRSSGLHRSRRNLVRPEAERLMFRMPVQNKMNLSASSGIITK